MGFFKFLKAPPPAASKRVLVVGWYDHGNLGDEAFKASFPLLWPNCSFTFLDHVPHDCNERFDAALFGGGAFLDNKVSGAAYLRVPVAFVGVSIGGSIHPAMAEVLANAKAIVVRDSASLRALSPSLQQLSCLAADLVFARPSWPQWKPDAAKKKVTLLLSEHFAPRGDCAEWQSSSWTWFCRELGLVLDKLADEGHEIDFVPMSTEAAWDDRRAAAMVISRMVRASEAFWYHKTQFTEDALLSTIATSQVVLSLRLHGSIFATAIGCPVVPVLGHDKMRGFAEEAGLTGLDYYAISASKIEAALRGAMARGAPATTYRLEAREKWRVASGVVKTALSL